MFSYIEKNYIDRCSVYLDKFKWSNGSRLANFRCPFCGDSKKSTNKARGYMYVNPTDNKFSYSCKNCGVSMRLTTFMKKLYPSIYQEYKIERLKELGISRPVKEDENEKLQKATEDTQLRLQKIQRQDHLCVPVLSLEEDHPAVEYLNSRLVPKKSWKNIFYTDNYGKLVNTTFPYNEKPVPEDARLVFELVTQQGVLYGLQGRSIDSECDLRYVTVKFDESEPSLWGAGYVDKDYPVVVLEGVMDALFLPNAVAILGGDLTSASKILKNYDTYMALDNEPRHPDTVQRMKKVINEGLKLCFWKIDSKYKDVNDMIQKGGFTSREIIEHIINNSYKGSRAVLELSYWKKTGSSKGAKGGKSYAN